MSVKTIRWTALLGAAVLAGGVVYVRAQVQTSDAPSLAAIASELRLLRQAVEKNTDTQTQIQALTAALSAQQSRLLQVSSRADERRKEVDSIAKQHADVSQSIATNTNALAAGTLNPEVRNNVGELLKEMRAQEQKLAADETQARTTLAEADAAVQTELARWTDLMNRLDQLARR